MRIKLAKIPLEFSLHHTDYLPLFEPFETQDKPCFAISLSETELLAARSLYPDTPSDAYIEHMELCSKISDALLSYGRVFFHGTAFVWREKAWIFSALSGTGKTTQYLQWKLLYGEEIQMLNGDKPILEFRKQGIWVHPSPWKGKENMGQMLSAPLGGIILLEQSTENVWRSISINDAILPLFFQFVFSRATGKQVHVVCTLVEQLLHQVPIWQLSNKGNAASAQLCHDMLNEVRIHAL